MAGPVLNRAFETTESQGVGAIQLEGNIPNFKTLVDAAISDLGGTGPWVINYLIDQGVNWEAGQGILTDGGTGPDSLSRDVIEASTNFGSRVPFGPGVKNVTSTITTGSLVNVQPGDMRWSYVTAEPGGWLLCDGRTLGSSGADLNGSQYRALFDVLVNIHPNSGTEVWGSAIVALPDMRGRCLVGRDNLGGNSANIIPDDWADVAGGSGGEATVEITNATMPKHRHTIAKSGADAVEDGGSLATAFATGNSSSKGSSTPHNNVQPSITCNILIKT